MRKGTRVEVVFDDITAELHTDRDLECAVGVVVGWILSDTKRCLKLITSEYKKGCDYKDRMTLPKGCITKMEEI